MKRRDFIKNSLAIGAGVYAPNLLHASDNQHPAQRARTHQPARSTDKPHVIFIMSDQQRADALGCMGNKAVISPNIDRLAQEGTLFVSGYSSVPSSTPARAGLLTGMSPWNHGMLGYGKVATDYKYKMPQMMRDLGYYTFGIGKMHWSPQKSLHGFHATLVDESGRKDEPDFVSDYREWFQLNAPGQDPDLTGIGWNDHGAGVYQLDEKLHPTTWTGQKACELIRNYDNDNPLFLKVSFARPHSPYDPPQRYMDLYKDVDIPPPVVGDWCKGDYTELKKPSEVAKDAAFANLGEEYAINSLRHYYASITFIDDQVGEIIKTLKEKGMYDNALICYVSDHGDMMGDHHHWRKTYAYEGSSKVPFIMKWPESMAQGIEKGGMSDKPVELRDLLPTFIDIGGGEVPDDMDGRSLYGLVARGDAWRKYIDIEHATCYAEENYWCSLTDGKVKYIWFMRTGEEQLFDLVSDPGEIIDLYQSREHRQLLEEMRGEMVNHLSERGDGFVKDGKLVRRDKTMLYSPNYPNR